jgi:hypothetical protein
MTAAPVVMRRTTPAAWVLMPSFLDRVRRFAGEYEESGQELGRRIAADLMNSFGRDDGELLGIGLVSPEGELVGHLLASAEAVRGRRVAFVLQWEKDSLPPDEPLDRACLQILSGWAQAVGAQLVQAIALDDARARLFGRLGFRRGGVVLTLGV